MLHGFRVFSTIQFAEGPYFLRRRAARYFGGWFTILKFVVTSRKRQATEPLELSNNDVFLHGFS